MDNFERISLLILFSIELQLQSTNLLDVLGMFITNPTLIILSIYFLNIFKKSLFIDNQNAGSPKVDTISLCKLSTYIFFASHTFIVPRLNMFELVLQHPHEDLTLEKSVVAPPNISKYFITSLYIPFL
jgi:hypothetical protein